MPVPCVGVGAGDLFEEGHELLVPVPRLDCAGDGAGGDLQGGEQRGGAVSEVVVGTAFGQPGLQRQDRRGPVQGLDLGFLVHAQHDRVLRRVQVQADHVGDLADQLRVGGEPKRLRPPRLDPVLPPRLGHCGVGDAQLPGQQPGGPVRHRQLPRRRRQRRGDDRRMVDRPGPTRALLVVQTRHPAGLVTLPPADHRRPRHPHQPRDRGVRHPIRGQQHDPRPLRQPCPHRRGPSQPNQLLTVTLTQSQRRGNTIRHTPF